MAPRILVAPWPGGKSRLAAKYFTASFRTKKKFFAQEMAKELKKDTWLQVFLTMDKTKCFVEITSV